MAMRQQLGLHLEHCGSKARGSNGTCQPQTPKERLRSRLVALPIPEPWGRCCGALCGPHRPVPCGGDARPGPVTGEDMARPPWQPRSHRSRQVRPLCNGQT